MKEIRIKLDFLAGPIWQEYFNTETKESSTGISIVDGDHKVNDLNKEIQNLFSSYYHFYYNDNPYFFDRKQEKKDKEKMLKLLEELRKRLNEINDGSFIVIDEETERIQNL